MMKSIIVALLFMSFTLSATAAETRGVVFNQIDEEPTELDKAVHDLLGKNFKIVDFRGKERTYSKPVPREGSMPNAPFTPDGRRISGYVLVVYVVTTEGRAIEPHAVKTTDARLTDLALGAMKGWRFRPGQLDGKIVSTTAAQEFHF